MTNQEAIWILREKISENECYFAEHDRYPKGVESDYQNALHVAIGALEKQKPKKPNYVYEDEPLCPYCGAVLDYCESPCKNCNQFIDWSEEE